jgi:long-chain acyl-CoA synthetase
VLGAIVVPILPDFHENEVKTIIEHSEAKKLFVSEGLYKNINKEATKLVDQIILVDKFCVIPAGTPAEDLKNLEGIPNVKNDFVQADVEEEDLASIIYTSGTTGNSKGVMLTHKNLAWMAQQLYTLQDVNHTDRFLSVLPLSHTLENSLGFLLPIKYGASVSYLRKPPVASVLLPALEQVKPTIMLSVPLIMEKIFKTKIYPAFQKSPVTRFCIQ